MIQRPVAFATRANYTQDQFRTLAILGTDHAVLSLDQTRMTVEK
jgi:hypothetical protein